MPKRLSHLWRRAATIAMLAVACHSASALADEEADEAKAISQASAIVSDATKRDLGLGVGKLSADWRAFAAQEIHVFASRSDYIIVKFYHPELQRNLFVKMTPSGRALAANFSGEF